MMAEEKIPKLLTKLAVPGIIAMLINAIYNTVDSIFVGMLGNTSAMGAVTVGFPIFMLVTAVGLMFGVGTSSYISRLLGQKNKDQADKAASTSFFTAAITALVFTGVGIFFLQDLLKLFGATETILPYATDYSRIILLGSTFTILNMSMNNMIRAEGSPKYSMIAISLGAILNIALDPLFMFTFNMGINGAAAATVVAQGISTVFLLYYYISKRSLVSIHIKNFAPSVKIYYEILKIGVSTLARQGLTSISMGLINKAAVPYGDAAVASVGISTRIISIAIFVVLGYCQGLQPVVGFNYGAGSFKRLKESISFSLKTTTIFSTACAVLFILFADTLVRAFSSDPEVIRIGSMFIRSNSLLIPLFGFQNVYAIVFQSIGKGVEALILSVSRQGLFLIPSALILPRLLGLYGVCAIQPTADILTVLLTMTFAVMLKKELNIKIATAAG